jgi:hypothetical protein
VSTGNDSSVLSNVRIAAAVALPSAATWASTSTLAAASAMLCPATSRNGVLLFETRESKLHLSGLGKGSAGAVSLLFQGFRAVSCILILF